jgi:dihydroxy-acid dehydratase
MVMGTASTMALCTEALGMMLPGGACPPAVMAERMRHAEASGARAVGMAKEKLTPDRIMTPAAFENALTTLLAVGGSTNAIVHLTAMAGRLGIKLDLDGFDRMGRKVPVLVDLKPTGVGYMEDLYKAGGLAEILKQIKRLMNLEALTVTGRTLGEELADSPPSFPQQIVRTTKNPVFKGGSIAVLRGNLAPGGAIIKQAAMDPKLARHEGRAVVFESLEDLVKDMVRISDARMSGTAFGSIVLHVTPESAMGGPLALVQNGDRILLDVPKRRLELKVSPAELARRKKAWRKPAARVEDKRGYRKLFMEQVTQADRGCDFDFCVPELKTRVPRT